jgi:hypothetical protein
MVNLIPKELQNIKIPQTQKLQSVQRRISGYQDSSTNYVIYDPLDEKNNQLSEVLEPFDSQSVIGQEKLIGNLLHEEDDFSSSDNIPTNFQQDHYERGRSNDDNISDLSIERPKLENKPRNSSFDRTNIAQKNI